MHGPGSGRRECLARSGMAQGKVKFFNPERGWGAITSPELPPGQDAFVHFSVIDTDGYRSLDEDAAVEFEYVPGHQDSFRWVVTTVRAVAGSSSAQTSRRSEPPEVPAPGDSRPARDLDGQRPPTERYSHGPG